VSASTLLAMDGGSHSEPRRQVALLGGGGAALACGWDGAPMCQVKSFVQPLRCRQRRHL
jgi:hypothetical protein